MSIIKNGKVILQGRDLELFEAGEDVGWNTAIEAAAKCAERIAAKIVSDEIRKLKK